MFYRVEPIHSFFKKRRKYFFLTDYSPTGFVRVAGLLVVLGSRLVARTPGISRLELIIYYLLLLYYLQIIINHPWDNQVKRRREGGREGGRERRCRGSRRRWSVT